MSQALVERWGPLEIDLLFPPVPPTPNFCELEARPSSSALGCILTELAEHEGISLSLIHVDRTVSAANVNRESGTTIILVAPVWPAQPWYPLLLQLCTDIPLLFPMSPSEEGTINHTP